MRLTATEAFLIGAAAILVLLALVEAMARIAGASFLDSVILGEDNRTSTSKAFVFMWTLLVGWALISMVIAGEFIRRHACTAAAGAVRACTAGHDQIGLLQLGWQHFISSGLSNQYLVLLGIPAAAAVAAKAITQSKTVSGAISKPPAPKDQPAASRIAEIFSADDNTTDIGDFQYMVFNLVAAVYFIAQFVQPSGQGLPVIPDTLLGMTTVSAALYISKKATARTRPAITGVFPSILRAGQLVTITGIGLTTDPGVQPQPAGAARPEVTINGIRALDVTADPQVTDRLTATVPPDLLAADGAAPAPGTIQVLSPYGAITPAFPVQLSG